MNFGKVMRMKISCTIHELGTLVRECERGMCMYCVLKNFCSKDIEQPNGKPLEALIAEITPDDTPIE